MAIPISVASDAKKSSMCLAALSPTHTQGSIQKWVVPAYSTANSLHFLFQLKPPDYGIFNTKFML
jgi:hypothetical protein